MSSACGSLYSRRNQSRPDESRGNGNRPKNTGKDDVIIDFSILNCRRNHTN